MKAQSLRLISVNNFKVQIALLQQFIFDNKNLKKKKRSKPVRQKAV